MCSRISAPHFRAVGKLLTSNVLFPKMPIWWNCWEGWTALSRWNTAWCPCTIRSQCEAAAVCSGPPQ